MVSSIVVNSSNSNYQVFLLNINNLHIAVWFQIISHNNPKIEQFYLSNEWTLTGQSRPENNGNEQVLYISKSSRIEASTKNTVGGNGVVLLDKDAVSISYNPSHRAAENSHSYASVLFVLCLFVAASHQTRLDTWSKARRPIKVGIKGRGRSGTSRDSNPAGLCCSSAHLVQCEPDEASSFTNPNVGPGTYAGLWLELDSKV